MNTFRFIAAAANCVLLVLLSPLSQAASNGPYGPTLHKWRFAPTINAPWAMEEDEAVLDSPLLAAGLCRSSPFNGVVYAPLASNVDVIVGDGVNNSGFSNRDCATPQNETTIAVNPTNTQNLIAGANDYRICCDRDGLNDGTGWAYVSFTAGATWQNILLPKLTVQTGGQGSFKKFDSAGDPVVAFSPDGVAYYANIVFSRSTPASGIVVSISRDGGLTWSDPNLVAFADAGNFFLDKEWIAAGANGKVVVTWTRFNQGPRGSTYLSSNIVGAISKDYGKTWNRQGFPISDPAHPYNQGSQVQFGPDGTLYVAYEGASPSTGYNTDALILARSVDDGMSFSTVELARVYDDLDCYPIYAGRQTLTDMHFRINSYPSMSIDPTTGNIALTWADNEGSGTCGSGGTVFTGTTANKVKLIEGTWPAIKTTPAITVAAIVQDKVFPSVAANGGKSVVTYYTRDYAIVSAAPVCNLMTNPAPSGIAPVPSSRSVCLDYAAASSASGFTTQLRLSTESSNPFIQFANGSFIGDYTQVTLGSDGLAHAAWTDFRGNPGITPANQDVLVQSFRP